MGLSKIKVPKNNNNEDTLRVWGVPPHFQPPYNVRQDLTMRPSKTWVDQCPSSSLVSILTTHKRTVSSAKRWLITHGVTGRFNRMTACCSSFHHDPMFASPGVFSAEASNIFKCGCSRTGDLNHQKKNESGDTVSWDHGIIPRGFKLWKHSETTRSSHPVRTGSRTEEVLTLWCSKQGRVSNLQVRGYMMINVATNAATIAVTSGNLT